MFQYPYNSRYSLDALSERDLRKMSLVGVIFIAGLVIILGMTYSGWLSDIQPILKIALEIGFCGIIVAVLSWVIVYDPKSSKKIVVSAK